MTHFLQWSVAQVCSLAGQETNAVIYIPGYGSYALHKGATLGSRIGGEKEASMASIYKEIMPYAPDMDSLVIGSTNCQRGAESAINKFKETEAI